MHFKQANPSLFYIRIKGMKVIDGDVDGSVVVLVVRLTPIIPH